jgi:hypothetical protein
MRSSASLKRDVAREVYRPLPASRLDPTPGLRAWPPHFCRPSGPDFPAIWPHHVFVNQSFQVPPAQFDSGATRTTLTPLVREIWATWGRATRSEEL